MLLQKLLITAFLAPLCVVAATTDAVFTSFENLHQRILSANECVKTFDGGIKQGLFCGYHVYNIMTSSSSAKQELRELDSVPPDQVDEYLDRYHDIRASVKDALATVNTKTDKFDSAGLKVFTSILLQNFLREKTAFEVLTKEKIAVENHSAIAGPVLSLHDEFENALGHLG